MSFLRMQTLSSHGNDPSSNVKIDNLLNNIKTKPIISSLELLALTFMVIGIFTAGEWAFQFGFYLASNY